MVELERVEGCDAEFFMRGLGLERWSRETSRSRDMMIGDEKARSRMVGRRICDAWCKPPSRGTGKFGFFYAGDIDT